MTLSDDCRFGVLAVEMSGNVAVKVYDAHRCGNGAGGRQTSHRSYLALIQCAIPSACWIYLARGKPATAEYAVIAWCAPTSVTLWDDAAHAAKAKADIDRMGCGHACVGRHDLLRVLLPGGRGFVPVEPKRQRLTGVARQASKAGDHIRTTRLLDDDLQVIGTVEQPVERTLFGAAKARHERALKRGRRSSSPWT